MTAPKTASKSKPQPSAAFVEHKLAADTKVLVTNASEEFPEDPFRDLYSTPSENRATDTSIIEPTYKPSTLRMLTTQNNILMQCIEAMEVNIDGTGHQFDPVDPTKKDSAEVKAQTKAVEDLFTEPYPNKSMIALRRELRVDLESTGNAYIEVIRNAEEAITLLNRQASDDMRLLYLGAPVEVEKVVMRGGKEVRVRLRVRERRFVQMINGKRVYFKEYGASRHLDRDTGLWAEGDLPINKRASEIIHLKVHSDAKTPYGVPRWINQLPSVLGSRKAEEHNLSFFDSGGLPPVLVFVQGGYLGTGVKDELEKHLSGGKGKQHRAAVVEAIASSGSLDSSGSVKVTVERFGADRMNDAMFQSYDKATEEHVRVAFRLPPLFIGRAQDYNFATALTGYMVAEAQVFAPERLEFDERIRWIVREFGAKDIVFRSKPMTLSNIETQLKAIELGLSNKVVTSETAVKSLNDLSGLTMEHQEPPDPMAAMGGAAADPFGAGADPFASDPTMKADSSLPALTARWASALGLRGPSTMTPGEVMTVKAEVEALPPASRKLLETMLAAYAVVPDNETLRDIGALCAAAGQ